MAGLPGPVIGVPRRTGQPVAQQVIAEQLGPAGVGVATQTACQANCYKVMLLTGRKDPAVHRFYEGAGFRGGEKAGYIARPTS